MRIEIPDQGKVLAYFGNGAAQHLQWCEEFGELAQAVSKANRARHGCGDPEVARLNLLEELADTITSIEQIKSVYGIRDSEIQSFVDRKYRRILKRIGVKA